MKPAYLKSPLTYLAVFLLLAGCAALDVETARKALEKRKAEPCQCSDQPPVTIIFVED